MTNTPNLAALTELDDALKRHAWPEAFDALRAALESTPPSLAVSVATSNLAACLPIFEKYRPKAKWPRAAMAHFERGEVLPDDFDFSPDIEGVNPMIVVFLNALDLLEAAIDDQAKPVVCAVESAKVILASIMVRRYEIFAKTFPKDWRIVLQREAGEEDLPSLKSKYLDELIVQEYAESLWAAVLAAIQAPPSRDA